jgi:hypothetical protein
VTAYNAWHATPPALGLWPLYLMFGFMPLWWVLGGLYLLWPVFALVLAVILLSHGQVRSPLGVTTWLVLIAVRTSSRAYPGAGNRWRDKPDSPAWSLWWTA